jgi:hypothetical protein
MLAAALEAEVDPASPERAGQAEIRERPACSAVVDSAGPLTRQTSESGGGTTSAV